MTGCSGIQAAGAAFFRWLAQPPNLIVIYADAPGWGELGCQGNKDIPTPPIDATSDNGPLRGFKMTTYEGGPREPFLAQWKGTWPAGQTYDHPVMNLAAAAQR